MAVCTIVCRQEVERLHGAEMKIFDYLVEKLRKLFMIRNLPHCQIKGDIWSISLNKIKNKNLTFTKPRSCTSVNGKIEPECVFYTITV